MSVGTIGRQAHSSGDSCRVSDPVPSSERPTVLEVESARGMIARFDAIEQLAAGSMAARRGSPHWSINV